MNKQKWYMIGGLFLAVGLALALSAGTVGAQVCDPKTQKCPPPPPKGTGCSPGFYKNHLDFWVQCCDGEGQPSCASLLTALTCKGSDALCGRSAAALYLDGCTGCSE